jgi:hypothetical protein
MNQMVAMTGSIAHEIKQPIAAIVSDSTARGADDAFVALE